MPVARCVLGEEHRVTLKMRLNYAAALCEADGATLDDLRESVATFEDTERIARRVLGARTRSQYASGASCSRLERRSPPAKRRRRALN